MSLLWWALLPALALAEDERDEDAIFGGSPAPPPPADAPAAPPAEAPPAEAPPAEAPPADPARDEDAMFGGAATPAPAEAPPADPLLDARLADAPEAPSDQTIFDRLSAVDERLAIGGQLYLRLDATAAEGQPAGDWSLSSPSLLDLYADARPNDRLRAYVRGRLRHDVTVGGDAPVYPTSLEELIAQSTAEEAEVESASSVLLDQLWFKFDVGRKVFVTAGRQRIKWGAGRFWNPTDFMNQQVLDSLSVFDERVGVALVRAHVPFEAAGVNVYLVGNLEGADTLRQVGGAARVEWLVGNTELSASAAARDGSPLRLGADLSTALWVFDLRVEGAVQHGVTAPSWEGSLDYATFTVPTAVDREDDWIPQVVAGLELPVRYNDEDALTIGVEGFYNDAGYADEALYPWLLATGQFQPFYLGRAYAGAYLYLPAPGRWDDHAFTLSALSNLSDRSAIARFDWRGTVLTRLSVNAYVSGHMGQEGGEYRFGLDIPGVTGVEGMEEGISVPTPVVDAGVGLQLTF